MNILIVTGEKSAENYASLLVDELKNLDESYRFYSICSDILSKKTEKIADYRDISVIGIKEALGIIGKAVKTLNKTKKQIKELSIDALILLDFPEFNMRIAKFAKSKNLKVIYYISPQVWAWREYRIKALFNHSDLIVPILPFEKTFFHVKAPLKEKVAYLGHPLVDLMEQPKTTKRENIVLIMPGSRISEIKHNAPPMIEAARIMKENLKEYRFIWGLAPHLKKSVADNFIKEAPFVEIEKNSKNLMQKAKFGILKSGTTTLEAAISGLPMVVVYNLSRTSLLLGKILIKNIRYISLPNLIAGKEIVPELIGSNAEANNIAEKAINLITDNDRYKSMQESLRKVTAVLGEAPVTRKIAERMHTTLKQR